MTFGCALRAPHGGIFVFPVVDHAVLYCVAPVSYTHLQTVAAQVVAYYLCTWIDGKIGKGSKH